MGSPWEMDYLHMCDKQVSFQTSGKWWAHLDSNQGPTGYEPGALPAELWAPSHTINFKNTIIFDFSQLAPRLLKKNKVTFFIRNYLGCYARLITAPPTPWVSVIVPLVIDTASILILA